MSRTARVPAALHSELTEYASLLRALRTSHTLDLSAHLSQLPRQPLEGDETELSSADEDEDDNVNVGRQRKTRLPNRPDGIEDRSDPDVSRLREGVDPRQSESATGTPAVEEQAGTEDKPDRIHGRSLQTQDGDVVGPRPRKKRKQTAADTWTRWPLLAGDVHRPEWGLADEVQLVALRVQRQQREAGTYGQFQNARDSDADADADFDEEELEEVESRALAASTAAHLRMLLSVCSAHVPRVEPSLRSRLAPLNWTGVLAAAGTSGLVPPEALERVGARLGALFNSSSTPFPAVDSDRSPHVSSQAISQPSSPSVKRHVHAASAVRTARENLRALVAARVEQGDGDFLAFVGPRPPPETTRKRKRDRRKHGKEGIKTEDKPIKKGYTDVRNRESLERRRSRSVSAGVNGKVTEFTHGSED